MSLKLLTIQEVANLFNVSKQTIYRMAQSRILPFYKIGSNLRFKEDEMLAYIESQRVKPAEEWFYIAPHKAHSQKK